MNILSRLLLRLLTLSLNTDRDSPLYMIFTGDDTVEVQKQGDEKRVYRY